MATTESTTTPDPTSRDPIERYAEGWEAKAWTRIDSGRWATGLLCTRDEGDLEVDRADLAMIDMLAANTVDGEDVILLQLTLTECRSYAQRFSELRMSIGMAKWLRDGLSRLLATRQPT